MRQLYTISHFDCNVCASTVSLNNQLRKHRDKQHTEHVVNVHKVVTSVTETADDSWLIGDKEPGGGQAWNKTFSKNNLTAPCTAGTSPEFVKGEHHLQQ